MNESKSDLTNIFMYENLGPIENSRNEGSGNNATPACVLVGQLYIHHGRFVYVFKVFSLFCVPAQMSLRYKLS